MQRYQGPLLHAAYDLQSRIYNVLARGFFARYFVGGTPAQQHYAAHNTAFLIAQFFGWTEIIRQEVQFIDFAAVDDTRRLADLRDALYGLWQSDTMGDPLMVWAGEQRAIRARQCGHAGRLGPAPAARRSAVAVLALVADDRHDRQAVALGVKECPWPVAPKGMARGQGRGPRRISARCCTPGAAAPARPRWRAPGRCATRARPRR